MQTNRNNILIIVDVKDKYLDHIANVIKQYYHDKNNIYIEYCRNNPDYINLYKNIKFNLIIKFFWYGYDKIDAFDLYPQAKKAICVYDYIYWNKNINKLTYETSAQKLIQNIKKADYILYACPIIKTILFEQFSETLPNKLLYPIYNGVDINKFYYKDYDNNNYLIVGWVGNIFNVYKRYDILKKIVKDVKWLRFRPLHENKIVNHEQIVNYYHSVDVIVCLSDGEDTPMSILEASACGRVWISTDVGIVKLLYDACQDKIKPGIIINNTIDLLRKLRYLYRHRYTMQIMGKNGRKTIENSFSWENKIKQFGEII